VWRQVALWGVATGDGKGQGRVSRTASPISVAPSRFEASWIVTAAFVLPRDLFPSTPAFHPKGSRARATLTCVMQGMRLALDRREDEERAPPPLDVQSDPLCVSWTAAIPLGVGPARENERPQGALEGQGAIRHDRHVATY